MRESTDYYKEFCETLVHAGYDVFIHDARGHGRTAGEANSPEFAEIAGYAGDDGINRMVDDLKTMTDIIKKQNPGVPVFLLGHSMGSVLSRLYSSRYGSEIDGLIYSGTTGPAEITKLELAKKAAVAEMSRRGRLAPAVETTELLFGHFNDRFAPAKTGFEYMSRDEIMVKEAILSPYANIPYRCGFYVDFLQAMLDMDTYENLEKIPKDLPIFSVSGSMDQFGDYGQGIIKLFSLYHEHDIRDASFIVYEGGRHEMLREINRQAVFKDIIVWLDRHTAS